MRPTGRNDLVLLGPKLAMVQSLSATPPQPFVSGLRSPGCCICQLGERTDRRTKSCLETMPWPELTRMAEHHRAVFVLDVCGGWAPPRRGTFIISRTFGLMTQEPTKPEPAEPSNPPLEDPQLDKAPVQPPPSDPGEDRPRRDPLPPDGDKPRLQKVGEPPQVCRRPC
jgi:hypothetical protein